MDGTDIIPFGKLFIGDQVLIPEITFGTHMNPLTGSLDDNAMFDLIVNFT